MTLNAIFQSRGFDAAQISHIQVEGVYIEVSENFCSLSRSLYFLKKGKSIFISHILYILDKIYSSKEVS
jgi:hypothetical protein